MTQTQTQTQVDVLILGAGAAGLMAAIECGRRGRRTLVLDHADRPGKKILISGGGRCNFTNLHAAPENFLSANPHFARSALARYTPADFLALVEKHRIPWHEKHLGQLFCDRSAHDILNLLLAECATANVRIQLSTSVLAVRAALAGRGDLSFRSETQESASARSPRFEVETSAGPVAAQALIVATGGFSIPKMGATGFGYDLARQFGLAIVEPRPALVPLVFSAEDQAAWCDLAGTSAEVVASVGRRSGRRARSAAFREKLLITHRGLSGPAALQISSFWSPGEAIALDLAPEQQVFRGLLEPNAPRSLTQAIGAARKALPARWAERWVRRNTAPQKHILSNVEIAAMEVNLHAWQVTPAGTEGYAKAEVTAGGVSTDELDARTLQARKVPGLFFIGEVVDVTGWLGGYNFQWAWASGFAAGQSA